MSEITVSPQDPYRSFLVSASAGSGKTYQLSRRFLHLVAAGAAPESILTVTFTIKAASEMRSRILEDAAQLCTNNALAAEFAASCSKFFDEHKSGTVYKGRRLPPPLSPHATGEKILAAAQALKITTIDAVFLEWVARFPYEAGADPTGEQTIPAPFDLASRLDEEMFRNMAWKALCRHLANILSGDGSGAGPLSAEEILQELQQEKLAGLKKLIHELHAMDTYLWHEEMVSGEALLELSEDDAGAESEEDLLRILAADIRTLAQAISNKSKGAAILSALAEGTLKGLQEAGLLTKDLRVSGTTVSKKVRDQVPVAVTAVERELNRFLDRQKVKSLNRKGRLSYKLFQLYRFFYNQLRFARNAAEFSDLVKGSFALFHSEGSLGVKFLLSRTIHHLMLDEFQDTSVLQWSVFKEVADHLLAGDSLDMPPGPQPSLFVVGDEKQSIYGFREADPEVMGFVRESYEDRLVVAPMNDSYRTANVILKFVNEAFRKLIKDFPEHRTAAAGAAPFIPDHGQVGVLKVLPEKPRKSNSAEHSPLPAAGAESPPEAEAEAVAGLLEHVLTNAADYPVYDKKTKSWRPLRADDCAVLYRGGTHAGLYDAALRRRDIPCQRDEEKGYFARPEIADMVALLKYLAAPADLIALLTVAKSRLGGVPDPASLRALAAAKSHPVKTGEFLAHLKPEHPAFVAAISELAHAAIKIPPHELIIRAYKKLGVLAAYTQGERQSASESRLAEMNLIALIGRALQAEREGVSGLFDLCRWFESMSRIDETGNAAAATGAVTLMTIHKSKGLEYPLIILADAGRAFAKADTYWTQVRLRTGEHESRGGVRREDKVVFSGTGSEQPAAEGNELSSYLEASGERTAQEAHRLLYVALTRAQHYLFVTGHSPSQSSGLEGTTYHGLLQAAGHGLTSAGYTPETKALGGFDFEIWSSTQSAALAAGALQPAEHISLDQEQPVMQDFPPDVTALGQEIKIVAPSGKALRSNEDGGSDPQTADWEDLLSKEVLPPDMAAAVGTLVHRCIETHLRGGEFVLKAEAEAAGITDKVSLKACRELCAKALASQALPELTIGGTTRVEVPLACLVGDQLVRGSADLVVERADDLIVVDYKSTRFALKAIGQDLFSRTQLDSFVAARGYDRQLDLYAKALSVIHPGKTIRKVIWFIDTDYLYWL